MPTKLLFPTFIQQTRLKAGKLQSQALEECHLICADDAAGRAWSKKNHYLGYTSYASASDLHRRSSTFERLVPLIDREVARYAKVLEYELEGRRLELCAFWVNIVAPNGYHGLHLHPHAVISGTYYLDTPKNSGRLKLEDPRLSSLMTAPGKKAGAAHPTFFYVNPKAGDLVLFESYLRHEVEQNRSKQERVSVSFNYAWV